MSSKVWTRFSILALSTLFTVATVEFTGWNQASAEVRLSPRGFILPDRPPEEPKQQESPRDMVTDFGDGLKEVLRAAEGGDAGAQFIVGLSHESAERGQQDFRQAAAWYKKAAAQDLGAAQAALGYLYQTGMGVPQDDREAFALYQRSAETGDANGQFLLGVAYVNGIGTAVNAALAAQWLHASADAGHQQSQLMLATMLQSGTGTAKNEFAARRWFNRAASGPDSDIATRAADLRQQIDDRVLFSGAFRPSELAAIVTIGFGLAALMANVPPGGDGGYDHHQYHPMQDPQARMDLCLQTMGSGSGAGCF